MQARIYESRQDQKRRAYAAYSSGDMHAGEIVDQDVHEYMEATGETNYSKALAACLKKFGQVDAPQPRPRPTIAQRYSAGNELDQIARDLMKWKGIGYAEGLKQAMLGNPILAETYGDRPVRRDGFEKVYGVASALQKVSNLITGTPRQNDGSLDMGAVLDVLELFGDLNREAAQEGLTALARKAVDNLPGQVTEHLPRAMDEVRRRYPALRRMAETGEATEEAVRVLYPQFFRN
jgi:hypothetical protein